MSIEVPIIILTLAIPLYFLSKWILKKCNFGNEKNRTYLAIISTIALSPIVYIGLIYLWMFWISYYPTNVFDKQVWMSNSEERYKMSENIIESKMLIGKTKLEIVELLGNNFHSYSENHIAYQLGFVPGLFNIDPDVLDVYFKNGRVIKVGQHET
ncbi:MAG: hypothetical protein BM564_01240 [Bacteroidetes bacterium MedPE-SWsnd-G2]|nr:MAG: hypothetical protein BM564_01240 [Bacteroidetes bacterium MedPE-SWsnd-G2]